MLGWRHDFASDYCFNRVDCVVYSSDAATSQGAIRHPVVTLQVRRSDKRGEDPFWNLYGGYRDLDTYVRTMVGWGGAGGKNGRKKYFKK